MISTVPWYGWVALGLGGWAALLGLALGVCSAWLQAATEADQRLRRLCAAPQHQQHQQRALAPFTVPTMVREPLVEPLVTVGAPRFEAGYAR